jgi:hypothetical protein
LAGPVTLSDLSTRQQHETAMLMPAGQQNQNSRARFHRQLAKPMLEVNSADTQSKCLRNLPLDHQRDGLHFPI